MNASAAAELQHYADLDRRLLHATSGIRILSSVAWPASLEAQWIDAYGRGKVALPTVAYAPTDHAVARAELAAIELAAGDAHPLGDYLRRTAGSWNTAAQMLEAVGTAAVIAPSITLYGRPGERIRGTADPTRENTGPDGKASSVQFIRFGFSPEQIAAFKVPGSRALAGFDHPNYGHLAVIPEPVRAALAEDFD